MVLFHLARSSLASLGQEEASKTLPHLDTRCRKRRIQELVCTKGGSGTCNFVLQWLLLQSVGFLVCTSCLRNLVHSRLPNPLSTKSCAKAKTSRSSQAEPKKD